MDHPSVCHWGELVLVYLVLLASPFPAGLGFCGGELLCVPGKQPRGDAAQPVSPSRFLPHPQSDRLLEAASHAVCRRTSILLACFPRSASPVSDQRDRRPRLQLCDRFPALLAYSFDSFLPRNHLCSSAARGPQEGIDISRRDCVIGCSPRKSGNNRARDRPHRAWMVAIFGVEQRGAAGCISAAPDGGRGGPPLSASVHGKPGAGLPVSAAVGLSPSPSRDCGHR